MIVSLHLPGGARPAPLVVIPAERITPDVQKNRQFPDASLRDIAVQAWDCWALARFGPRRKSEIRRTT